MNAANLVVFVLLLSAYVRKKLHMMCVSRMFTIRVEQLIKCIMLPSKASLVLRSVISWLNSNQHVLVRARRTASESLVCGSK